MATPGVLVIATAHLLGVPENFVVTPWRVLREAGEVTVGGRGKHAAHVTMEDAAKLFIAVAASSPLKSTLESWREFAQLRPMASTPAPWANLPKTTPFKKLRRLPKSHRFLDALSALMLDLSLKSARDCVFPGVGLLEVTLYSPQTLARISLGAGQAPLVSATYVGVDRGDSGDLLTATTFRLRSMGHIAQLVASQADA